MAEVLARAVSMVAIILIGYLLKRRGFVDKSLFSPLSRLSLTIILPCVIISKFSEFEVNKAFLILIPMGVLMNLITIAFGYILGAPGGREKRAYNMINFSGFNIGAFVLPFTQVFLGAESVVALCLFDCGNSIMCTGGTYALASTVAGQGEKQGLKGFLKKLFSSIPMDTYLIMTILSFMGIKMPLLVRSFTGIVGNANAFMAMFLIGLGFEWRMKKEEWNETMISLAVRYGLGVLFTIMIILFLPFSHEVVKTMVVASLAPLSALTPIFTQRIGGDVSLSSTLNSITIVISTIIITTILVVF